MPDVLSRALSAVVLVATCVVAVGAHAQNVKLVTSEGVIEIQLEPQKSPKTVENFLRYVKSGDYDGTIFHRVIDGFMIQGGGMTPAMVKKPTRPPIALESHNGLLNVRGTVAMARTGEPDSATSQFFINVVDNTSLDPAGTRDGNGYAVFGKVVAGMDVVDKIKQAPTGAGDVPKQPIIIKSASVEK